MCLGLLLALSTWTTVEQAEGGFRDPVHLQLRLGGLTLSTLNLGQLADRPIQQVPVALRVNTSLETPLENQAQTKLIIDASLVHAEHGFLFWSRTHESPFLSVDQVYQELDQILAEAFELTDQDRDTWDHLIRETDPFEI